MDTLVNGQLCLPLLTNYTTLLKKKKPVLTPMTLSRGTIYTFPVFLSSHEQTLHILLDLNLILNLTLANELHTAVLHNNFYTERYCNALFFALP